MANWCTTYYAILTKKNYEGLARIWEQLKLGRAVIHYKDTEILVDHVGAIVDENMQRIFSLSVEKEYRMKITYAEEKDTAAIAAAEAACFPPAEAATEQEFVERIKYYGNHFWLLYDADKLIAFVDGFVTDEPDLTDTMYENACMHNENGAWQMIFGVNTLPEYRKRGYAGELIRRAIADARQQGRKGLVLTCKERLIAYYAKFGFVDEGVSEKSTHGNVRWHQMRLTF